MQGSANRRVALLLWLLCFPQGHILQRNMANPFPCRHPLLAWASVFQNAAFAKRKQRKQQSNFSRCSFLAASLPRSAVVQKSGQACRRCTHIGFVENMLPTPARDHRTQILGAFEAPHHGTMWQRGDGVMRVMFCVRAAQKKFPIVEAPANSKSSPLSPLFPYLHCCHEIAALENRR